MADVKETLLTAEGLKKLEDELAYYKSVRRIEVSQRIKTAIEYGDISEQSMAQPVLDSSNEVRKIEAPATVQSRSSVIGETIGTLTGDRQQGKSKQDEQPMTFVFSPTYHFEGEAPSKEDIVEANRMSQAEFEKLMKEWMKKHKRTSFA